ncbi:hypothetical protein LINPERHAP1_LOCUS26368 [Linum perenne]
MASAVPQLLHRPISPYLSTTRPFSSPSSSYHRLFPFPSPARNFSITLSTHSDSPPWRKSKRPRCLAMEAFSPLRNPIIYPDDHWGTWTALFAAGAFGVWSEKTKLGSMVKCKSCKMGLQRPADENRQRDR